MTHLFQSMLLLLKMAAVATCNEPSLTVGRHRAKHVNSLVSTDS